MFKITLKKLSLDVIIGVYEYEKKQKQKIFCDLELTIKNKNALLSDDLNDTIDYSRIEYQVKNHCENTQYKLIEKLAQDIINMLFSYKLITEVALEISKPQAVKFCDTVILSIKEKNNTL